MAVASSLIFLIPPITLAMTSTDFHEAFSNPETMTGKFKAMGFGLNSMIIILVTALIKTSLSEEIFFRGFLAKRLIAWLGFQWGNLLQAIIFGALHLMIFLQITESVSFLIFMLTFVTIGSWIMVYINERIANGSILPSWITHGLANTLSYSILAFLV